MRQAVSEVLGAPPAALGRGCAAGLLLLAGCGTGTGAPEGWLTLGADGVRVSYPKGAGWVRQEQRPGRPASVVLERGGTEIARISLYRGAPIAGAPTPDGGGGTDLPPDAEIVRSGRLSIGGREAAETEYTYRRRAGSGRDGEAAPVRGVDVTTDDRLDPPLLVRVSSAGHALTDVQLRRVVNSLIIDKP